jgi:hypothetical protein
VGLTERECSGGGDIIERGLIGFGSLESGDNGEGDDTTQLQWKGCHTYRLQPAQYFNIHKTCRLTSKKSENG